MKLRRKSNKFKIRSFHYFEQKSRRRIHYLNKNFTFKFNKKIINKLKTKPRKEFEFLPVIGSDNLSPDMMEFIKEAIKKKENKRT